MSRMPLAHLRVSDRLFQDSSVRGWRVETCQRRFVAWSSAEAATGDTLSGADAYEWLLRVACGLESRIVGETDVFGQLKAAWSAQAPMMEDGQRNGLHFWVQKIFEDAKEVRAQYLQGVGGSTYGTRVRNLLAERVSERREVALLVGAGQLGEAILPFLGEFAREVRVWNRSSSRLAELRRQYRGDARLEICSGDETVLQQWIAQASVVVMALPADSCRDGGRVSALSAGSVVMHLGVRAEELGPWSAVPDLVTLDSVFEAQQAQDQVRATQAGRAERACRERAQLRDLAPSLSVAHGWEDLAVFA